jgi:hypothetical protein
MSMHRTYPIDLKGRDITLIPFACVHAGSPGHHAPLWQRFLQRTKQLDAYTLGVGDYMDFARTSYRKAVSHAGDDENSVEALDFYAASTARQWADEFMNMGHPERCIGLLEGNHYWTFQTTYIEGGFQAGQTTTQFMAQRMGVPYLGHTASIILQLTDSERWSAGAYDTYKIIANHGYGSGGSSASADLGRMERVIEPAFDADLYVTAHTHRRLSYFMPRMVPTLAEFAEKPHLLVKAGSFFRTYVPEYATYADQKFMRPVDLGWVEINLAYEQFDGGAPDQWERRTSVNMAAHEFRGLVRTVESKKRQKRAAKGVIVKR